MKLSILAVGKLKSGPEREIFERYFSRVVKAGRQTGLAGLVLKEIPESRNGKAEARCRDESQQILSCIGERESLILLDESGKDIDSQAFTRLLRERQETGCRVMHFAIGGADGHAPMLRKNADHVIRFGSLTWPHQIVRILLAEQLYRAVTILSGHPYHRDG